MLFHYLFLAAATASTALAAPRGIIFGAAAAAGSRNHGSNGVFVGSSSGSNIVRPHATYNSRGFTLNPIVLCSARNYEGDCAEFEMGNTNNTCVGLQDKPNLSGKISSVAVFDARCEFFEYNDCTGDEVLVVDNDYLDDLKETEYNDQISAYKCTFPVYDASEIAGTRRM